MFVKVPRSRKATDLSYYDTYVYYYDTISAAMTREYIHRPREPWWAVREASPNFLFLFSFFVFVVVSVSVA